MLLTEENARLEMRARLLTTGQLRQAQEMAARFRRQPTAFHELPLTLAGGRVLARDLPLAETFGIGDTGQVLPAGTKLDWRVLPLLSASGHSVVPVHAAVRCGLVTTQAVGVRAPAEDSDAAAAVVHAALERMGVQVFRARSKGIALDDDPALATFAKFCDLVLVLGDVECPGSTGPGVAPPCFFDAQGRPCAVLPACPQAALAAFIAFGVPLVRRLQGRSSLFPPIHRAVDDAGPCEARIGCEMTWASTRDEQGAGLRIRARVPAPGQAMRSLAGIAGIGWKAEDLSRARDGTVAFLPFEEWLD